MCWPCRFLLACRSARIPPPAAAMPASRTRVARPYLAQRGQSLALLKTAFPHGEKQRRPSQDARHAGRPSRCAIDDREGQMFPRFDREIDALADQRVVDAQDVRAGLDPERHRLPEHEDGTRVFVQAREDLALAAILWMLAAERHGTVEAIARVRR